LIFKAQNIGLGLENFSFYCSMCIGQNKTIIEQITQILYKKIQTISIVTLIHQVNDYMD